MVITAEQLAQQKSRLEARRDELRGVIQKELNSAGHEGVAGQVHDIGEESLADLLVGLDVAIAEIETQELMDTRAALDRIDSGQYGICIDCGESIALARLESQPAAARCIACQEMFETNSAPSTPRL